MLLIKVDDDPIQWMAAERIFPLERTDRIDSLKRYHLGAHAQRQLNRAREFQRVHLKIRTKLKPPTKGQHSGKNRVPVPAPKQVGRFRPGVGIIERVLTQSPASLTGQPPEVAQFSAYQAGIVRQVASARQPMGRLVDADYQCIWMLAREVSRGFGNATAGIQHQRRGMLSQRRNLVKGLAAVLSNRLLPAGTAVAQDGPFKPRVQTLL